MAFIPNTIPNVGVISYQYQVDPNQPLDTGASSSNIVNTRVNNATIIVSKSVNLQGADLNDELTYTLTLQNTGNTAANNILLTDTIPSYTAFKSNSVLVNNNPITGVDPQTGVMIPTILPNDFITVSFIVMVVSLPSPNPVINSGIVKYSYTIDPNNPNGKTAYSNTNIVSTTVTHAQLVNYKFTDKENATVGDIVTYTLVIKNTGNTTANCITLFDTIPKDTSFINNSLTINGFTQDGATPQGGLGLEDLGANSSVTITFKVKINTIPNPNPIPNSAFTNYEYIVFPDKVKESSTISNTVNVNVSRAIVQINKKQNKQFIDVNEELEYTLTISNIGNVAANNIVVIDTIPNYTTFKFGSVYIGGVNNPTANPVSGINIATLGSLSQITVTFTVISNTIPPTNPIKNQAIVDYHFTIEPCCPNDGKDSTTSNIVDANINKAVITSKKYVNSNYSDLNDKLIYTLVLTNNGNSSANDIIIYDTIPEGTIFESGSVTINNAVQPSMNPQYGIIVPSIAPLTTTTLTFRVLIVSIPINNPINNQATGSYKYTVNPSNPNSANSFTNTNNVKTTINHADIVSSKSLDTEYATVGDIITYNISMKNQGNTNANNIVLIDSIPLGTSLVNGSVTINGSPKPTLSPATGIVIGTLTPSETALVSFKILVVTLPPTNKISNQALIQYNYTVNPDTPNSAKGSSSTNVVSTDVKEAIISNPTGGLIKLVDKAYSDVNEVLTYTINLKNVGNTAANNVVIFDTIPPFTSFIENSVEIEGNKVFGVNPQSGIQISSIQPDEEVIVTFKVKVTSIPLPNPIKNLAKVNYSFTKDPNNVNSESRSNVSNEVTTEVFSAIINNESGGLVKSTDSSYSSIGDIITYSILLSNKGNSDANNVILYDALPSGTSFVKNSVEIDDSQQIGLTPDKGIPVRTIIPGMTVKVSFKALVTTIPSVNPINNSAEVTYNYTSDPNDVNGQSARNFSNSVFTKINEAILTPVKTLDKSFATIGDNITYTIRVKNEGNIIANNIILYDTIPNNTDFIQGSIVVNGNPAAANISPESGIPIPSIQPNETVIITFKVKILQAPTPNPILNQGILNYTFTPNPNSSSVKQRTALTNNVSTKVNYAIINGVDKGIVKIADVDYAKVSDTINYTISLTNTGNTIANNVILFDSIPSSTSFVKNSVYIDNISRPSANPTDGIVIGNLSPGELKVIRFSVIVVSIPMINPVLNQANVTFDFVVDPINIFKSSGEGKSNIVKTTINQAFIRPSDNGLIKTVSTNYASINDVIVYTITLTNTGNVNADNVVLKDTIPNGTTFIPNSVTVNGSQSNDNPTIGINIGTIQPAGKVLVSFKVLVNTIPNFNPIMNQGKVNYDFTVQPDIIDGASDSYLSNIVSTTINEARIINEDGGLIKQVNKRYSDIGEILTYSVYLKNTGNVAANNIIIYDTIPSGATFVQNSVTVNGAKRNGITPTTGIQVGSLSPGNTSIITFDVLITSIPSINPLINNASVEYNFVQNPQTNLVVSRRNISNNVQTTINNATISNSSNGLFKYTNKDFADINEEITYTISLKNTGNVPANNIIFNDTIPIDSKLIPNSIFVNGVQVNPNTSTLGIKIDSLAPNEYATITFKVLATTLPNKNPIINNGMVNYSYTVDPSIPNGVTKDSISNNVSTTINTANIRINKNQNVDFTDINNYVTYTIILTNTGNVDANNIVFFDTIPNGTVFIADSVKINNNTILGVSPINGISISKIAPTESAYITFNVLVSSIPTPNPTLNQGYVKYSYTKNPNIPNGVNKEAISNTIALQVNNATVLQSKTVNKPFSDINDILVYTFALKNTGNVTANNLVLFDTIPQGTTFVNNSISINGIIQNSYPETGITVGDIPSNKVVTVSFQVKVITIPSINPILNTGISKYSYIINPITGKSVTTSVISNVASSKVNHAEIITNKYTNTNFADVGDEITYTITLKNIGNVPAGNVAIFDTLPNNLTFISGSAFVNNTCQPGANPNSGLALGCIYPDQVVTLTFKAFVNSLPSECTPELLDTNPTVLPCCATNINSSCSQGVNGDCCLYNVALTSYGYVVDPSIPTAECTSTLSNSVKTCINTAIISNSTNSFIKSVDKAYADVGDTLTYTLTLINKGNTIAQDVIIYDTLPSSTSLIPGSITINGAPQLNTSCPENGIGVGSISPGGKVIVSFKASVLSIPSINPICNEASVNYKYIVDPVNNSIRSKWATSNLACTRINNGHLISSKLVDKQFVTLNETLTYSFNLKNIGNVPLMNVILFDTLPIGTSFIQSSILVNGKQLPAALPYTGVNVGNILPSDSVDILFKVKVDTLVNAKIQNFADVSFSYTVDPSLPNGIKNRQSTNIVSTELRDAIISSATGSFNKTSDSEYVDLGEKIHFTISSTNIGTVTAENVIIRDVLNKNTKYVSGSLTINGVNNSAPIDLSVGIPIGTIEPNKSAIVEFDSIVISIPSNGKIDNKSTIGYTFTKNPLTPNDEERVSTTNVVNVNVRHAELSKFTKTSNTNYAMVGDILTFNISGINIGNVDMQDLIITDILESEYDFIDDSVQVNGVAKLDANISQGVNVGIVKPGNSFDVLFRAKVVSAPSSIKVLNTAKAVYKYIVNIDDDDERIINLSTQNIVSIKEAVISPNSGGFTKTADKEYVKLNDIVNYTIKLTNSGNVEAINVEVIDKLQSDIEFIPGSVEINSSPQPVSNILDGILIDSIKAYETVIIKFKAKVVSIPESAIISNVSFVKYEFFVDPSKAPISKQFKSNEVSILVNSAEVSLYKSVNPQFASLNDEVTYSNIIYNKGNAAVLNAILTDTLPKELTFIPGTVIINNQNIKTLNPASGLPLGSISSNSSVTITFKAIVSKLPTGNTVNNISAISYNQIVNPSEAPISDSKISNIAELGVKSPIINIMKSSNLNIATIGDIVEYKITISNSGNIEANNLLLVDLLDSSLQFIDGSVSIDNTSIVNASLTKGILIPTIPIYKDVIILFKAKIISNTNNVAKNKASASYSYFINSNGIEREGYVTSNEVIIDIEDIDVVVKKTANKSVIVLDESILYTIVVENKGTVQANNVELVDSIPQGLEFIEGSFTLNGSLVNGIDIREGVNIGNLLPGQQKIITYEVKASWIECSSSITNYAYVLFTVNVSQMTPIKRVESDPTSITIAAASPKFKEMSLNKIMEIPIVKPDIEDINDLQVSVSISNTYIVNTIKGISADNRRLTGYKLIINGIAEYTLEYTAALPSQSVHSAHWREKFSTYIIVDEHCAKLASDIDIDIEDISYRVINSRSIFGNVTMNLTVR